MAVGRTRSRRRVRWLKWTAGLLAGLLVVLSVVVAVSLRRAEPLLRAVIVENLRDHFHARVELDGFQISLVHGLTAEGKGLRIWPPAEVAGVTVPGANPAPSPLIRLEEFRFHAPLHYDPEKPIRISVMQLRGLDIDIPAKTHFTQASAGGAASGAEKKEIGAALLHFEIDAIQCKDAHLTIETSKPNRLPLEFAISQIKVAGVSAGGQMHFDARLTIPRPAGIVTTSGQIGPWEIDDPGETPVAGGYTFDHADLGVFKGIAGILESRGRYHGALRDLEVEGTTETPDFRLTHFGAPMRLDTHFQATVDGTNGDTYLHPVDAVLGRSHFTAEGEVVGTPPEMDGGRVVRPGGHDIALDVFISRGEIGDFLRLASKSGTPMLTGDLTLRTKLDIPPGTAPVQDRMRLKGNFSLDNAQFTSAKLQDDVGQLSLRAQGDAKEAKKEKQDAGNDAISQMKGDFTMAGGVITLPNLTYTVPGAEIDVTGKYGLEGGTLEFAGTARMQATVSKMVGGWKGLLLKPADPLFKKGGAGTVVPIHIEGTREHPEFGVDLGRVAHTHPAKPGEPK